MARGKQEKYLALAESIRRMIDDSSLRRGDVLPPERNLSVQFGCNHLTVRKALRLLEQNSIIHKIPSKGSFVGPRPLDGGHPGLVGFIFPDDELFYYRLFSNLENEFKNLNLHPVVHLTRGIPAREDEILDFLTENPVTALIAAPNPRCKSTYQKLRFPVLFFDNFIEDCSIPYVISDDNSGAVAAMEYLYSLEHRKIAYIGGLSDRTSEMRLKGYQRIMQKYELHVPRAYIKQQSLTREWGFQAAKELLEGKDCPSAVFCANDTVAAGVVRYCQQKRLIIPDDLSVVGFGNTEIAEDLFLTSVDQHSDKIAAAIGKNLKLILNGIKPPLSTMLPATLVVRRSTGHFNGAKGRK